MLIIGIMTDIKWYAPQVFGDIDTSCFVLGHILKECPHTVIMILFHTKTRHGYWMRGVNSLILLIGLRSLKINLDLQQDLQVQGAHINHREMVLTQRRHSIMIKVLERPDGSIFTADSMLAGTEEAIICPFENHKGGTQTAKIWKTNDGGANIFCQKTNCIAHHTIRMATKIDLSEFGIEVNADIDLNKLRKPKVEIGYDKTDLYIVVLRFLMVFGLVH